MKEVRLVVQDDDLAALVAAITPYVHSFAVHTLKDEEVPAPAPKTRRSFKRKRARAPRPRLFSPPSARPGSSRLS